MTAPCLDQEHNTFQTLYCLDQEHNTFKTLYCLDQGHNNTLTPPCLDQGHSDTLTLSPHARAENRFAQSGAQHANYWATALLTVIQVNN